MMMKQLLLLGLLGNLASAAVFSGKLNFDDRNHVAFLGKFTYDYHPGNTTTVGTILIDMNVVSGQADENPVDPAKILFFNDAPHSWPLVYKQDISCEDVVKTSEGGGSISEVEFKKGVFNSGELQIRQKIRPRFWYVAVADCKQTLKNAKIEYSISMKNILRNGWSIELGTDQRGINSLYLVMLFAFTVLLGLQIKAVLVARSLGNDEIVHPVHKLFTSVVVCQWFAVLFITIHWLKFTSDGYGSSACEVIGELFDILHMVLFLLLLVLIAQGWTITSNEIKNSKSVAGISMIFLVMYVVTLFIKRSLDPASTTYIYSSGPGVAVVVFNNLAGCWFLFSIWQSYKEETDKDKLSLYRRMGFIFTPYFLTLMFLCIVALFVDPWYREIVIATVSLLINLLVLLVMCYIIWPSRAESYFRITESQVGKVGGVNVGGGDLGAHFVRL